MTLQTLTDNTVRTVARFFETPAGRAITDKALAEQAAATHAERLQLVAEQARLRTLDAAAVTAHEKRTKPIAARMADLERQLAAAVQEQRTIDAEHRADLFTRSQALDRIEARLYTSRPAEAIEGFVDELQTILEKLRLDRDDIQSRSPIDNKVWTRWSNRDSLIACSEAMRSSG